MSSNASEAWNVRTLNRRSLIILFFAALLSFQLPSAPSLCTSYPNLRLFAVSDLNCTSCVQELQTLLDLYGEEVTVYNIREPNHTLLYNSLINLTGFSIERLPLVTVFIGNRLFAVVFGPHSQAEWEAILGTEYEQVPVYYNRYMLTETGWTLTPSGYITEQENVDAITELFIQDGTNSNEIPDIYALLPLIALAAVADAVNPCEFYVLVVFLSLTFYHVGRKAVLKSGLAYSVAIFTVYFLMGVGLLKMLEYAQQFRLFVVAVFGVFGLFMGVREVLGAVTGKESKRVPEIFSERLSVDLRKISENPLTAFAIGIATGVFLLPCTSGPYFTAVVLISDLGRLLDGLILLLIYNSIVVAPFIAITLCIYALRLKTGELKRWSSRNQRRVSLISGAAILILSLYLLSTILP
jgi:cytochrome c biogenesis protein CcdA